MKIMTFNTQHCQNVLTGELDYPLMAQTVLACDADIVGLNEMRGRGVRRGYADQTKILSELTALPYRCFADALGRAGAPYGNALLSRYPILYAKAVPIPLPHPRTGDRRYEPRCILHAEIWGGYTVLVTHFGLNRDEQENAVRAVTDLLAGEKCILMGDFNVLPDDPVLLPIRERMRDAADAFSQPLYSWPSEHPTKKIDYLFVSPDLKTVSADIPAIIASDHRPHTAVLAE